MTPAGPTLEEAVDRMLDRLGRTATENDPGFPHVADATTGAWTRTPGGDWTGAFFVGQLWLAAATTADRTWRTQALDWAERLRPRAASHTVFRGFLFWYGAAIGAVLLDDPHAERLALEGARALASSFHPRGRLLPLGAAAEEAHSVGPEETNIDGVPGGAPLLYLAAARTGDPRLADLARSHVQRHVEFCVRPDDSVVQSATFDPETGKLLRTYTHKGIRDDSTWARAQAWAMLGVAQAARHDPSFTEVTARVCDWWIRHLPASGVSFWDFDAAESDPLPDTAATAIAAAALLKAAVLVPGRADAYRGAAETMVRALVSSHLTPVDDADRRPHGMLVDGCYNRRIGLATSSELIWGDYFLLESLLALSGRLDPAQL